MTKPFSQKALREKAEAYALRECKYYNADVINAYIAGDANRVSELRELLDNKAKEIESELIVSFDEHQTQSGKLWILAELLAELDGEKK